MILNEHEFKKEKAKINFKIVPSELNSYCLFNSDTTSLSITNFPIINLVVKLSQSYPLNSFPTFEIPGFYFKFKEILLKDLEEKWMPE